MPQPDRLLATLHRATAAFRTTPGRRGHVVAPADAVDILVAGDLHGNVDNFRRLLQAADLGQYPRRHLVLQELIHGKFRYPDGSDKSHQLLDLTAALKCQFPQRVHFLPGNHELSQWTNRRIGKGDEDLNDLFRQGVSTAYGQHATAIYAAYIELLRAAPLVVRTANRVFLSHSVPAAQRLDTFDPAVLERDDYRAEDLVLGGTVHALLWGRSATEEHALAFLRKVDADWLINGHITQERGYGAPSSRQLILDAQGTPACYCLFPADRPLSQQDLINSIGTLAAR
jgi:hypothetical protein